MSAGTLRFGDTAKHWHKLAPVLLARLPGLLSALLVVLLAWTLADLAWRLVPAPALPRNAALPAGGPPAAGAESGGSGINELIALHLFGVPDAPAAETAAVVDAPETRLNLVLRGVLAAGNAALSRAIIASGSEEHIYAVGAALPGGATIHSILAEKVVLRRAGQLETLSLPRESGEDMGISYTAAEPPRDTASLTERFASPPAREPDISPAGLERLRRGMRQNPGQLLDIIRPQPVSENGRQVGYRVYPGPESEQFRSLGLQAGDLVTAVNGQPLSDPAQSLALFQDLESSDSITLTVQRNGREEQIVISPTR